MHFVKVTDTSGNEAFINLAQVTAIMIATLNDGFSHTTVDFVDGEQSEVQEKPEEIINLEPVLR
jgi:hypothetical protein